MFGHISPEVFHQADRQEPYFRIHHRHLAVRLHRSICSLCLITFYHPMLLPSIVDSANLGWLFQLSQQNTKDLFTDNPEKDKHLIHPASFAYPLQISMMSLFIITIYCLPFGHLNSLFLAISIMSIRYRFSGPLLFNTVSAHKTSSRVCNPDNSVRTSDDLIHIIFLRIEHSGGCLQARPSAYANTLHKETLWEETSSK